MVKLKTRTQLRRNIRLTSCALAVLFCIITARAYFLQVCQSAELTRRLQNQHTGRILLAPRRGSMYDRSGEELAVSIKVPSLFARPHLIQDKAAAARQLAGVLDMPQDALSEKLSARKQFVWIKRQLAPPQVARIKSLNLDGLGFVEENRRYYPNRELAGQVLGFTGVDNQGLEGLEYKFDEYLQGEPQQLVVDRDAKGRSLYTDGIHASSDDRQGHDIVLTIDKNIQYITEKELQAAVELSGAQSGIAIVMDPWTGEILAMANAPLFNPNQYGTCSTESRRNRAVTDILEPGSTFKPFLVAAALEEGMIKPQDIFFCENGSYRVTGKTIHDVHPHGWLSVTKIIKFSSNIGVSKISKHLGKENFYRYIRKFGFAEETGVQVPVEAAGSVPRPYRCSEHTQSAIAFGQGIAVTPLQLATAYSALANGGSLVRPFIVSRVTDIRGKVVAETKPYVRHRVIAAGTAQTVGTMLESVVSDGGTGVKAAIEGFTVAGKTGTSQKTVRGQKGYDSRKTIASFAGYAPVEEPRVTVVVVIDEPQKMTYGGEIAAPTFSRITQLILNYLQVAPSKSGATEQRSWQDNIQTHDSTNKRHQA